MIVPSIPCRTVFQIRLSAALKPAADRLQQMSEGETIQRSVNVQLNND